MNIIELESITKSFGAAPVLDIPELCLEKGLRYGIIGANGSGKSTLLRIIAGVLAPDTGELRRFTEKLSYMPQKPYYFGFSVEKNVALAVRDKAQREKRTAAALEAVGLSHLKGRSGALLSGGEAQRMAFARILAGDGELVLMDEPTASADVEGAQNMAAALSDELSRRGATLVFTTHSPSEAAALADRIIVLDKGKIAEQGEAQRVLYAPGNPAAAAFLAHWRL